MFVQAILAALWKEASQVMAVSYYATGTVNSR